jgi:hypothetical protein
VPPPPLNPDDVRRLHALEQLGGVAAQMATVVSQFYHALVREGVPSPDAASLAGILLRAIMDRSATPEA